MRLCSNFSWEESQWNVTGYMENGTIDIEQEICYRFLNKHLRNTQNLQTFDSTQIIADQE